MVNTAVLAPIPRAKERIATAAKTGDLASDRRAYRNSPDRFMDTPHGYLQKYVRAERVFVPRESAKAFRPHSAKSHKIDPWRSTQWLLSIRRDWRNWRLRLPMPGAANRSPSC